MNPKIRKEEEKHLKSVVSRLKKAITTSLDQLEIVSSESLERLKELREGGGSSHGSSMSDFDILLEQLDQKNAALNIKGKYKTLEELEFLLSEPYFSRIDLYNQKVKELESFYIGKFSYTEKKPVVTDWRSKVASVYYRYRYPQKDVSYETPGGKETRDLKLKRTFEIQNAKLVKYYNNDLQLDENSIIIEKIKKRTGGVLEDIIQTIQESQLDIIESDPRQICIVQGCVGSGKSTVAIHKLAHIFFNFSNLIHPERCLLITKNQILAGYLSTLFPKLGIFDVTYKTVRETAYSMVFRENLSVKMDLDQSFDTSKFGMDKVRKLQASVINVQKMYEKKINKIFADPELESFASFKYSYDQTPYENIFDILEDVMEELLVQKEALKRSPDSPQAWLHKENVVALRKILKKANQLKNEIRNSLINKVAKEQGIDVYKKLNYCETLEYLYIFCELVGIRKFRKFEYCVVDEAQDFSPLDYLFLSKIIIRGRFALFGDLNQSLEVDGIENWEVIPELIKEAKTASKFKLTKNYRSTKQIISFANKILRPYTKNYLPKSINRMGDEPIREVFVSIEEMLTRFSEDIKKDAKKVDKSIGIICFGNTMVEAEKVLMKIKPLKSKIMKLNPSEKTSYTPQGVYLMNMEDCKGLEFSKVYVLGLNLKKIDSFSEARKAFVAVTRAMNELYVYGVK